ncbi:L,D-transpeptidase family protein [Clostridium massiliodielmoense]|uniref:L,D-transpeptidase family protein n=1 Tax=Clostridium massiliodielmoense TaxID=1776385 RepID=UPI0004D5DC23|nr:L,D-transpeptidase family protein [Clostridium massiliodielmoense]KEH97877.1 hypothetical protein Z962_02100 [Clostridium botulinum C/D str. BKT12695]
MRKHEKNAIIIFFTFLFLLSTLCVFKIHKRSTKKNILLNSNTEAISKTTDDKISLQKEDDTLENRKSQDDSDKSKIKPKEEKFTPLRLGCKGNDVKALQNNLNKFGYKINADGIFGSSTEIALYDFQRRNNLNRDCIAGESTLKRLALEPTEKTMYDPKDNIFSPVINSNSSESFINKRNANSQTDYYIWVNTNTPKTYIFKGYNHHWKLIKSMSCTVGKSSSPTIKGTFKVGNKGEVFIVKNNPKLMCKYFTQISGNYLFHTVLLNRNGTIANGTLGAKVSHGCIRLSMENAKYIYNEIPKGSTIYIN